MTLRPLKAALLAAILPIASLADGNAVLVQSTTSTANSGLYDHLLPQFTEASGIDVHVVAVGTGQAIRNAMNCDGDVLLVHAKAAELTFVDEGFGTERADLMYNDFVIVGPDSDPGDLGSATSVSAALTAIAQSESRFASRGDDSGTHKKELSLWAGAGLAPQAHSGAWYLETGSGMGATLNTGIGLGAYVITDRATWISFGNKQDYQIVFDGDPSLFNQYGVIPVSPAKCPDVNVEGARIFVDWLISKAGQQAIASYRVGGQQLFFPNAPH